MLHSQKAFNAATVPTIGGMDVLHIVCALNGYYINSV